MSTYIKISKPAYVAITDFMGKIAAKHDEGWAKDVHTVMRRRGAGDGTVKVEVSYWEGNSVGVVADKLAHTSKPAAKLLRHLKNKGLYVDVDEAEAAHAEWEEQEWRKGALKMGREAFIAKSVAGVDKWGGDADDKREARKRAEEQWSEDVLGGASKEQMIAYQRQLHEYRDKEWDAVKNQAAGKPWYYMTGRSAKQALEEADEDMGFNVKLSRPLFGALGRVPADSESVIHTMNTARFPMYAMWKLKTTEIDTDVDGLMTLGRLAGIVAKSDWASAAAKRDAKKLYRRAERVRRSL